MCLWDVFQLLCIHLSHSFLFVLNHFHIPNVLTLHISVAYILKLYVWVFKVLQSILVLVFDFFTILLVVILVARMLGNSIVISVIYDAQLA